MKRIKFNGLETEVSEEELKDDVFDVDFNGRLMVRFSRENGVIIPINAMNGGGYNCFGEIRDEKVIIEDI